MHGEQAFALPDTGWLTTRWQQRRQLVVIDTCFGPGAGLLHVLQALAPVLAQHAGIGLHYIALTPSVPRHENLLPGLATFLPPRWLPDVPGIARIPLNGGQVQLTLCCGPLDGQLGQLQATADLVLLHTAPWTTWDMRQLAQLVRTDVRVCAPENMAGTVSLGGFVPDGEGSFRYAPRHQPRQNTQEVTARQAIVIGAGLAGCAVSERLVARGWQVTLLDRREGPAQEVSGNPAGIYMPLLSKDDNVTSRLLRTAYLYALAMWDQWGGVGRGIIGEQCGVLHVARDAVQEQAFRAMETALDLPQEYAQWLEADVASERIGHATHGSWFFPEAGWVRPSSACAAMLAACAGHAGTLVQRYDATVASLRQDNDQWQAMDAHGQVMASAPVVIVAAGMDALHLGQLQGLPLQPIRGQVTMLPAETVLQLPHVLCGDGYLTRAWEGEVSVGASYDKDVDMVPRTECDLDNLAKLGELLPGYHYRGETGAWRARVGLRCVVTDRLPLVGALADPAGLVTPDTALDKVPRLAGLYSALGYASRGLIWAPLAAELLACRLTGEPLPVGRQLADALDPARFVLKGLRRRK